MKPFLQVSCLWTIILVVLVAGLSAVNQEDYAHEGKKCTLHLDCRVRNTGMICITYEYPDPTKWTCGCQTWIRGEGERIIPYYNEDVDHCVLRDGQLCSLFGNYAQQNTIGNRNQLPTFEDYECEPGANCVADDKVKDHGRCVRNGSAGALSTGIWLILATAITSMSISLRNSA